MGRVRGLKAGWLKVIVCSPMLAFNEQGVMQAVPSRPSKVAVAPRGWLFTRISTEWPGRTDSFFGTIGRGANAGDSTPISGAVWAGSETSGLVSVGAATRGAGDSRCFGAGVGGSCTGIATG